MHHLARKQWGETPNVRIWVQRHRDRGTGNREFAHFTCRRSDLVLCNQFAKVLAEQYGCGMGLRGHGHGRSAAVMGCSVSAASWCLESVMGGGVSTMWRHNFDRVSRGSRAGSADTSQAAFALSALMTR